MVWKLQSFKHLTFFYSLTSYYKTKNIYKAIVCLNLKYEMVAHVEKDSLQN